MKENKKTKKQVIEKTEPDKNATQDREMEIVAECFIKGYNKTKTMERVYNLTGKKLYTRRLNKLLEQIMETWSKKGIIDKVLLRALELKRIDVRESELWGAWEESKLMDDGADARYLTELRRCSEQRSKLLGLAVKADQTSSTTLVWKENKSYGSDNKTN